MRLVLFPRAPIWLVVLGLILASPGFAKAHGDESDDATHTQSPAPGGDADPEISALPSPFPGNVGGDFVLTNHLGERGGLADYRGQVVVLFFGYASCERICPVALERVAQAMTLLEDQALAVQPLFVTVDPVRDSPAVLAQTLPNKYPGVIGFSGSEAEIAAAKALYGVGSEELGESITGDPVIAHGSNIFVIGREGQLLSILPPIIAPERLAEIVQSYL